MRILDHCKEGGYNFCNFIPKCDWEEDVSVQWGRNRFTIDRKNNTLLKVDAFFEAFPSKKGYSCFIRGEGINLEEAEKKAFETYLKIINCKEHHFIRNGRKDGYGFCKHCGMGNPKAFDPLTKCKICNEPCNWTSIKDENGDHIYYCREHDPKRYTIDLIESDRIISIINKNKLQPIMKDSFKDFTILTFFNSPPIKINKENDIDVEVWVNKDLKIYKITKQKKETVMKERIL